VLLVETGGVTVTLPDEAPEVYEAVLEYMLERSEEARQQARMADISRRYG
jgi:hypothetical protein